MNLNSCVNFCPQSLAPDFKVYTCVINNPYLSIWIHLVMQIRIALIPLITYIPPNDLGTDHLIFHGGGAQIRKKISSMSRMEEKKIEHH